LSIESSLQVSLHAGRHVGVRIDGVGVVGTVVACEEKALDGSVAVVGRVFAHCMVVSFIFAIVARIVSDERTRMLGVERILVLIIILGAAVTLIVRRRNTMEVRAVIFCGKVLGGLEMNMTATVRWRRQGLGCSGSHLSDWSAVLVDAGIVVVVAVIEGEGEPVRTFRTVIELKTAIKCQCFTFHHRFVRTRAPCYVWTDSRKRRRESLEDIAIQAASFPFYKSKK